MQDDNIESGAIVHVLDHKRKFIGSGYYNPKSKIRVRLLSRNAGEEINQGWFYDKISAAIKYREQIGYGGAARLIFGEADQLPGLVVDRFGEMLVIQTLTIGMDQRKEWIVNSLVKILQPKTIIERNDVPVRKLEGLDERAGILYGEQISKAEFSENDIRYRVDFLEGQKTGFFLDQKENRRALENISRSAEVLDCFCYNGSFSLSAAKFGAKHVEGLDASEPAVNSAIENAKLNSLESTCLFRSANAFDALTEYKNSGKQFDVVILDPPAFTKNREGIASAQRGYREINLKAMKILRPGGYLLTFSCSHFISPEIFEHTIQQASYDAHKTLTIVSTLSQAKDHPLVWGIDETHYLKGYLLRVN